MGSRYIVPCNIVYIKVTACCRIKEDQVALTVVFEVIGTHNSPLTSFVCKYFNH